MADGFSSAIGALSSIGLPGFLLNQASSAINSHRAWKYYKKQVALQDYYNRKFTKDYYGLNRQSLESAGYNPLYAIAGSTAQGANYSGTMMNADSDAGDQAVNSALNAVSTKANVENVNQNTKVLEAQEKGQQLDNRLKEKELNTNPKAILSDIISGNDTPYTKVVNKVLQKVGVNQGKINSAFGLKDKQRILKKVDLSDSKPYVQKGVSKSVVKSFEGSKHSAVSNGKPHLQVLSDKQVNNLSKKRVHRNYSKPPKEQLH